MNLKNTGIFYQQLISSSDFQLLDKEESIHCIKVLRKKKNDCITIINGKGNKVIGKIIEPNPKATKVEIIQREYSSPALNNKIHIAISPTKNINRFKWFIEKSIEIGIYEITPILTKHSERNKLNFNQLSKKMISALKQSQNSFLPKLNQFIKLESFLEQKITSQKFICHNENEKIPYLKNQIVENKNYLILIGPEGGFSAEEVYLAEKNGYKQVLLGDSRYRTETAGILACHTIHLFAS